MNPSSAIPNLTIMLAMALAPQTGHTAEYATSPDGSLAVLVEVAEPLTYQITIDAKPVTAASRLGLEFKDGLTLGGKSKLLTATRRQHDATWDNPFGKSSKVRDHFNETRLQLDEGGIRYDLVVRAYNDGAAFRYELPEQDALKDFTLTANLTQFLFPGDFRCWAAVKMNYEGPFPESRLSQLKSDKITLPLVVETPNALVAVAEADVRGWSGSHLRGDHSGAAFGARAALIEPVDSSTPRVSPWHALIITRNAADLTTSTMLLNLASPSVIDDISWIKPGIMAWDVWWTGVNPYWSKYTGLDARGNTRSHKDFIDLAADMGWPYMLVDWFWYDQNSKDPETAIQALEHIDMPALMKHAKEKGVNLILWVNSKNIPSIGAEKLFATYAKWGAVGVKIDFFKHNGSAKTLRWQEELLACAAKHKLLVNFHGTYTPTGLSRTWPNLITQEGVMGQEYCKLGKECTPQYMITLPFTRGLLGPSDITPGAFLNRTAAEFRPNAIPCEVPGTRARQLALSVLVDSPLLCMADSPENYRGQPGFGFYRNLPTVWDETKALSASMAGHLVQARRKGDSWWLAAMNGDKTLKLEIPLDFLGAGSHEMHVFSDTAESATRPTALAESRSTVPAKDTVQIDMAPAGGYTAVIRPLGGD